MTGTFATTIKSTWTVDEIASLRDEVEAAHQAALIAADIVQIALRHRADPDVFYANIGSAYRRFSLAIGKPVINIALSADVPHSTAARWVRESRRREHLEEA